MEIRIAEITDRAEIVALYERSQLITGLPDPVLIPPSELGATLYKRHALVRFVAIEAGRIVGHAITEEPNYDNEQNWRQALENVSDPIIEMSAAFVEPAYMGQGIWTGLLKHRLQVIRKAGAYPVSATWSTNEHVKRTFLTNGGIYASRKSTPLGNVDLFVFQKR